MPDAPHIMIVEARFYEDIADELVRGARQVLDEAGASVERFAVPGAFEIPAAIRYAIRALDVVDGRHAPTRRRPRPFLRPKRGGGKFGARVLPDRAIRDMVLPLNENRIAKGTRCRTHHIS